MRTIATVLTIVLFVAFSVAGSVRGQQKLAVFKEVAEQVGLKFQHYNGMTGKFYLPEITGSGGALLDFDNDGDLDVLISNNGEPPTLLRNQGGNRNNWIGLELIGRQSNRAAVGAVITWQTGKIKRSRLKTAGGSYLASHDPREVLGLGSAAKVDSVEIRWPSGKVDRLANPPINRYLKVIEGFGISDLRKNK